MTSECKNEQILVKLGPMLYNTFYVFFDDIMDLLFDDILEEEIEYQNSLEDQQDL